MNKLVSLVAFSALVIGVSTAAWAAPTKPYKDKVHVIPGTIELEDFDEGDEGVAYHDADPKNQEKKDPPYRETGVDLEWREAASGKFNLGWTRPGEWLVYTVDVKEPGTYRIDMHVACQGAGGTFHLEFEDADESAPAAVPKKESLAPVTIKFNKTDPITVPDTGGWQHLKPFTHKAVKLNAGRQVMKVVMDKPGASGSIGDIDYFMFTRTGK